MTSADTGGERRPTVAAEPERRANDLAPPLGPGTPPDHHGRHAVAAVAAGQAGWAPEMDLGDDSWQQQEIEADRRRERRLVWQSLIALAVVAALVLVGRVLG